jgi:hypothetical protein
MKLFGETIPVGPNEPIDVKAKYFTNSLYRSLRSMYFAGEQGI